MTEGDTITPAAMLLEPLGGDSGDAASLGVEGTRWRER